MAGQFRDLIRLGNGYGQDYADVGEQLETHKLNPIFVNATAFLGDLEDVGEMVAGRISVTAYYYPHCFHAAVGWVATQPT
jgi:hypothetical protein